MIYRTERKESSSESGQRDWGNCRGGELCGLISLRLSFVFSNNCRFTCSCKTRYREISCTPYSISHGCNIFQNYSTISKPGCQCVCNSPILYRFPQFYWYSCVCSMQFYHMCGFVYSPPQSGYRRCPSPQASLLLSFYNHTHLFLMPSSLTSDNH